LATLQNLVDFFTITIELVPVLENSRTTPYQSPFEWIRDLSPHSATLFGGKDAFSISAPRGFVVFDDEDEFRAQSADTTLLRVARLDNEPLADGTFWARAVSHEMEARGERNVQQGKKGVVTFQVWVNDDVKPRYYLVGLVTQQDDLFVIEAFFPNEASYERHGAELIGKLATFRPE
jgi:hypothetical protein